MRAVVVADRLERLAAIEQRDGEARVDGDRLVEILHRAVELALGL